MTMRCLWIGLALATALPATAAEDYDFSLEGHYRMRSYSFGNLFSEHAKGSYATHQLRLQPVINFQDRAKFTFMVDALDDVMWGDNMSASRTSLFAGDPTNTNLSGQEISDFRVRRAWTEFNIPVGILRVGRQPSHWGMGLLANQGTEIDDTFGENHYGSTYDRVMFLTKPLAITNAFFGFGDAQQPFFVAFGVDRLVEDPLVQYYGFECEGDGTDTDPRCEGAGEHGYTEDREADQRDNDWWADNEDDVYEFIYVLLYKGNGLNWGGDVADFNAGVYVVNRIQEETQSEVFIYDVYAKLAWKKILFEGEALTIRGETQAVALPSGNPDEPLAKTTGIVGAVGRVGYQTPGFKVVFEAGMASGDDNPGDEVFTGRALHPDHNVGLLLYEEILARVSQNVWEGKLNGLRSRGGVYNSTYIYPHATLEFLPGWRFVAAYLLAFPHSPDGAVIRTDEQSDAATLGWEVDVALKIRWAADHMDFSLEGAYAQVTDRIPYENHGLTNEGAAWTIQTRIAYLF
jgi:hypothetical protein